MADRSGQLANATGNSSRQRSRGRKGSCAPTYFHRWSPPPSPPPRSPSTERLKAAILLGQQMAEQEAIAMLAAKVRQARPDDPKGAEEAIRRQLEQLLGK
jgi:hypothetical protein